MLKLRQTWFCQMWYYFSFSSEYQLLIFLSNKTDLALMLRKSRKADFITCHYFSTVERHIAFPVRLPEWRCDCMSRHSNFSEVCWSPWARLTLHIEETRNVRLQQSNIQQGQFKRCISKYIWWILMYLECFS